ncbi:DNA-J related domain-containing protein [Alteromonas sp. MMG017]|uniref:DNA-J related domain-containing protein n=1 Tax=Alteromonas sp. MMG017 TaxID=2822692 RepID=UPI001FFC87C7|nr:DNA-J related domain-containing protein [Alteromonas sp. MMG017]
MRFTMGNAQEIPSFNATNAQKVELLLDILSTKKAEFEEGMTEYALISQLKSPPYQLFNDNALRDSLALFNTHFILFHTLYLLRNLWRDALVGELDIHATRIVLLPLKASSQSDGERNATTLGKSDSLADYYLNWQNLTSTGEADVEALLNGFWQQMMGGEPIYDSKENIAHCHAILNIDEAETITLTTLKRQYRKQLITVHPDKGGSHEAAQDVISAYQTLLRYYGL